MATPEQVLAFARSEAERQGVPVDLVQNMVRAESGGDINAVSPKGAIGPMQLMPATAKDLGVNPNNWQQNVQGGVKYIGQMLSQFEDPRLAVAAYNAGPGNVRKYGDVPPFKETQNYVQKVVGGQMDYDKLMQNSVPVGQQQTGTQDTPQMSYEDLMKASTPITAQQQQQAPSKESSFGLDVARGARDPIDALAQLLPRGLEAATSLGYTSPNKLSKFFGSEAQRVDEINRQAEQQYREAGGDTINTGRILGNVMGGITPGMYVTKAAQLAAPASRLAQASFAGGVSGGLLTPVERTGDFASEKGAQMLTGAVAGPLIDKFVGGVVSPAVTDAARKMKDLGVQLTPGQAFGGAAESIENLIAKLPLVGKTARDAQQRSLEQFNTGVINDALSDVGKKLPKGISGREAISYMDQQISKSYDDVLPKINVAPTLDIYQKIGSTLSSAQQELTPEFNKRLSDYVERNITNPLNKGNLSGMDFKRIDSQLGKLITTYGIKGGDDGLYADALKNVQMALRENVRAINPADAPLVDAANSAWAKKLRIEGAAGYLSGEAGQFTPSQLQAASKAMERTARKGGFSRGDALMQDIAEQGVTSLGRTPVQQSSLGLGGGALTLGGAGYAGGFVDPVLATILGGTALGGYTRPVQSAFNALMTSARPAAAPAVRQQLPGLLSPSLTGGYLRDEQIPRIELTGMAR
jgi:hypothetical protein